MPDNLKNLRFFVWWLPVVVILLVVWNLIEQKFLTAGVFLLIAISSYFVLKLIADRHEKNYKNGDRIWTRQEISDVIYDPSWLVEEPVIYDLKRGQRDFRGYVMINCGPIGKREAYVDIYAIRTESDAYRLSFQGVDKFVKAENSDELSQKAFQYACDRIQKEIINLG